MEIDLETKIRLVSVNGFAACADAIASAGVLRVYLLKDTPEVRKAVLAVIGDQLPMEQVVFEPEEPIIQCSFCGKQRREVHKLIESPTAVVQGKNVVVPVRICDECITICAEMIQEKEPV